MTPNREHLRYGRAWAEAVDGAALWTCPGLDWPDQQQVFPGRAGGEAAPPADGALYDAAQAKAAVAAWGGDVEALLCDWERNPFTGGPFFDEVLFFHKTSRSLFVTDLWWNYPRDLAGGSRAWAFGMDKVYRPFHNRLMITSKDRARQALRAIDAWAPVRIVPCHGDVVDTGPGRASAADVLGAHWACLFLAPRRAQRTAAAGGAALAAAASQQAVPLAAPEAGCVLVAPASEYNHFLCESVVFLTDYDPEIGARGVVLERPSALTVGEALPGAAPPPLQGNELFVGGENGKEQSIVLHTLGDLGGAAREIGSSGVYLGGGDRLLGAGGRFGDDADTAAGDDALAVKFFFNWSAWSAAGMEEALREGWRCVALPPDLVVRQGRKRGSLWESLSRA